MPRFDLNDYVPVQDRILAFWKEYPDGRIITSMESPPSDFERVVFKAAIYLHRDNPVPDVTGWDGETAGSGGANNTAHHANAETSAIGRALANLGYATSQKDRPSREEMRKATGPDYESGEVDAPVQRAPRPAPPLGQDVRPHEPAAPAMYQPNADEPATEKQMKRIWAKHSGLKEWSDWSDDALRGEMKRIANKEHTKDLTAGEADQLITYLAELERGKPALVTSN